MNEENPLTDKNEIKTDDARAVTLPNPDQKRDKQEMRIVPPDPNEADSDTFPVIPLDKSKEDKRAKTQELSTLDIWRGYMENTTIFRSAVNSSGKGVGVPETPDDNFYHWVSEMLDKAVENNVIDKTTATIVSEFVSALIVLAHTSKTDTRKEAGDLNSKGELENFSLKFGEAKAYFYTLHRFELGNDANFLFNYLISMPRAKHLQAYKDLFEIPVFQGRDETQEVEAYTDETFEAKSPAYWDALNKKCHYLRIDTTKRYFDKIPPPSDANNWFVWFGIFLHEIAGDDKESNREPSIQPQLDVLIGLATAINDWYTIIKNTPTLRNVQNMGENANLKDNRTLVKATQKYEEIKKLLLEINTAGYREDAVFVLESFFNCGADAHSFLPYFKLLQKN